jgi:ligand-binding SRPBCC domain-containing protein
METLIYEVEINAPIEKVWDVLWNSETIMHGRNSLLQILQCAQIGKSVVKHIF